MCSSSGVCLPSFTLRGKNEELGLNGPGPKPHSLVGSQRDGNVQWDLLELESRELRLVPTEPVSAGTSLRGLHVGTS